MRTMHLFAGVGGGLLADLILGHTPIVAVEWEPYACQVLRERSAEGWFPELSVWEGDVRMFDPSEYAGKVGCIHAGFPCQDISVAGKQAGVGEETRSGLYREVLRIAGVLRPRYLFLENVSAIVSNGLDTVVSDLIKLGYDSEWLCLRASDCGANHHRDRWWLLADSDNSKLKARRSDRLGEGKSSESFACNGSNVADSKDNGWNRWGGYESLNKQDATKGIGEVMADSMCKRVRSWNSEWKDAEDVRHPSRNQGENARGVEFWSVEPALGRVANGIPNRVGQLKGYGNAQVPLQAAVAWKLLGGE